MNCEPCNNRGDLGCNGDCKAAEASESASTPFPAPYAGLTTEESKEFNRILATVISELSKEEIEYFKLLNDRILDAISKRCC